MHVSIVFTADTDYQYLLFGIYWSISLFWQDLWQTWQNTVGWLIDKQINKYKNVRFKMYTAV